MLSLSYEPNDVDFGNSKFKFTTKNFFRFLLRILPWLKKKCVIVAMVARIDCVLCLNMSNFVCIISREI